MQLFKVSAFFVLAFVCVSYVAAGPVESKEDVFKVYNEQLAKKIELSVKEISTEIKGSISRLSEKFSETFEKVTKVVKDFVEHADLQGTIKKLVEAFSYSFKEATTQIGEVLKKTVKEDYERSLAKIKEVDLAGCLSDLSKKIEKEVTHLKEVVITQKDKIVKEYKEISTKLKGDPRYKEFENQVKEFEKKVSLDVDKIAKSFGFKQPIGDTVYDVLEKFRITVDNIGKSIDEKIYNA